ncbi:MAG TPA: hypothetical protein VMU40_00955 [Steroidobacteraceae bacterium]|nr:hypothetical protein [Steroidobacteraceae bacterium]
MQPSYNASLAIGTGTVRREISTVHLKGRKERAVGKFVVLLALGLATATAANADIGKRDFGNTRANIYASTTTTGSATSSSSTGTPTSAVSTPEIDPAGLFSGMTLLLGGLAVLRGRRKA